jgi:glyoxylase-like metal-dependent hydrolase (beta-lactamase superfamily II)
VIAKARELRPAKPITHVVDSHHHFDHSGGIRAAVSEGAGGDDAQGERGVLPGCRRRAHTLVPDALAKSPKPLKIEPVDDMMVIKDNKRTVQVFHIEGSPHADTLLMTYFPKERILVEADVWSPAPRCSRTPRTCSRTSRSTT